MASSPIASASSAPGSDKTNGSSRKLPSNGSGRFASRAAASPSHEELLELLKTVQAVRRGNFSARFQPAGGGLVAQIGRVLNEIIDMNEDLANELIRVSETVGREGRMA